MKKTPFTILIFVALWSISTNCLRAESKIAPNDSLLRAGSDSISTRPDSTTQLLDLHDTEAQNYVNYTNINEWLSQLSGYYASSFACPNGPSYLRYYHGDISQTDYFLDGIPLNHGQSIPVDLNTLPINAFQKAAFYSRDSFSHSIELLSKKHDLKKPYSSIMWHQGYSEHSNVDVLFGMQATQKTQFSAGLNYQSGLGNYSSNESEAVRFRLQMVSDLTTNWRLNYQFYQNDIEVDLPGPILNSQLLKDQAQHVANNTLHHALRLNGNLWGDTEKDISLKGYYNSANPVWTDSSTSIQAKLFDQFAGSQVDVYVPIFTEPLLISAKYEYRWISGNVLADTSAHNIDLNVTQQFGLLNNLVAGISLDNQYNTLEKYNFSPAVYCNYEKELFQIRADYQYRQNHPGFLPLFAKNEQIQGNDQLKSETNHLMQLRFWLRPKGKTNVYFELHHNLSEYPIVLINTGQVLSFINGDKKSVTTGTMRITRDIFHHYSASLWGTYSLLGDNPNAALFAEIPEYQAGATIDREQYFFERNLKTRLIMDYRFAGNTLQYTASDYEQFLWYRYASSFAYTSAQHLLNLKLLITIRNFEGFASLRNALGSDYEWMSGYPERNWDYKFGFLWHFRD